MARLRQRIGSLAEILLKNHLSGQNQADEQARSFQQADKVRMAAMSDKLSEAAQDPTKYDAIAQIAAGLKIPLVAPKPTDLQATQGIRDQIGKEQNPEALPDAGELAQTLEAKFPQRPQLFTPQGGKVANPGEDGNLDSTNIQPTQTPTIQDLLAKTAKQKEDIKAHLAGLASQAGAVSEAQAYGQGIGLGNAKHATSDQAAGDKLNELQILGPQEAQNAGLTTGAQEDARNTPDRQASRIAEDSLKAGETAKAQFPWQMKLAQTRADMQITNQRAFDDYKKAHPGATAEQLNQARNAGSGLAIAGDVRSMLDEMDKRGMIGAIAGRGAELATGRVKSEQLFRNPDDAKLAADYFSTVSLLQKLAAKVHGGVRAGASPQMAEQFAKIISGVGDRSIIEGQLNSVERILKHYADNPDDPASLDIPGGATPSSPQGNPTVPLNPRLQRRIGG